MNNRIPRNATRLKVTLKINVSSHYAGQSAIVEKDEELGGWHGGGYFWPVSLLRNSDVCSVEVLN